MSSLAMLLQSKRILLTGSTGFVGAHLLARLLREKQAKNLQIRCLVRKPISENTFFDGDGQSVEWIVGDLGNVASLEKAVEDCDLIFHLAGAVRAKNLAEFLRINADGTKNLALAACKRAANRSKTPPLFIYVSSLAAAGPVSPHPKRAVSKRILPKSETDMPQPISDYGRSKWVAEQNLAALANEVPCSIVRPGIVFGEGDKMNLEIFKTVQKWGGCPIPGWKDKIYSWIHADDLVELLLRVAESGERLRTDSFLLGSATVDKHSIDNHCRGEGVYFVSFNDGLPLSEIGQAIGASLGRRKTWVLRCPPLGVWAISSYFELLKRVTGKPQPLDWAKAAESFHHWRCTAEKAAKQLGFEPLKPWQDRIAQTTCWYLEQNWLRR